MNSLVIRGDSQGRRMLVAALLSIFASFAFASVASGATVTVNDDTSGPGPAGANCNVAAPHATIQSAIDDPALNDAASDTVLVCAGVYSNGGGTANGSPAAVAYRPGLDLIGARAGQDARSRPAGAESLISDPDGGIQATVSDITIDGFDIRDADTNLNAGIWLQSGTSNHRVFNNVVRDNGEGLAFANGSGGQTVIRFNFFDANNEIFGNGISADLGPTQNVLIDRNRFRDHANAGVIFQSTSTVHGFNENVQILNNQFENSNPDDLFNENRIVLLSTDDALIQGNTFTNNANNAVQLLGASQGVSVIGNNITGAGFSAVRINRCTTAGCGAEWDPNSNVQVLGNNLFGTSNSGGDGAGINIADTAYSGELQAHFNRIAGNDRGIQLDDTGETVDATNNWWGCNAGPSAPACDNTAGAGAGFVTTNPHLVLGVSTSPGAVPTGGTSNVTAGLAQNSAGATPPGNNFPAGIPIAFSATFGSVPASVPTASPIATTLFQAGAAPGNGNVFAALDNQSVSTPITVTAAALAQKAQAPGRCRNERTGNTEPNRLIGTDDGDRLRGRGGRDVLRGKAGEDCLNGGADEDRLNGGAGRDLLKGGGGDDVINAQDGDSDKVRCGFGEDRAIVDAIDNAKRCENVV
jgi:Right handed beta helix region/RTX calcium-binding nonapeptide repeat (4 copies)